MAKGGQFERDCCRELGLWWSGGDNENIFWRTSGSGARATVRAKKGKKDNKFHCGDIAAMDPIGQPLLDIITFELKRGYNKATFHALLDKPKKGKKQEYEKWMQKAITSAGNAGSPYWAIIHRRDRREAIVLLPCELAWQIGLETDVQMVGIGLEAIAWKRWLKEADAKAIMGLCRSRNTRA